METKPEQKATPKADEKKPVVKRAFEFPELKRTVEAETLEEAIKIINNPK